MRAQRTIKAFERNLKTTREFFRKERSKFYKGADRESLQSALRDHGFNSTEGRLELLSILKGARHPLSVPQITARITGNLDETNVYRSLEALTRAGILSRSDLRQGGAHYEMLHGHHHHHVVCNNCGIMEDVEECIGERVESKVLKSAKKFAAINTHALEFFGTCNSCATK